MPEEPKQVSEQQQFIKDVMVLQKYVQHQAKKDFFFDTKSENIGEITKALCDFITDLPKMKKDSNAMQRYDYQGLPAMLDNVNPILSKYGLKNVQEPHTIDKTTYMITVISHTSNQYFRCVTILPDETMFSGKLVQTSKNMQAMGSSQTYIKRYALKAMLGIDAEKDTDGGASR